MRHMRWSYVDLLMCPSPYIEVILEEARREENARKEARLKARAGQ